MLECVISVRCKKIVSNDYGLGVTKENMIDYRIKADSIEEIKSFSEEITVTALANLGTVIEKTDFETKQELEALKEVYG